jgi:hypothetical protein
MYRAIGTFFYNEEHYIAKCTVLKYRFLLKGTSNEKLFEIMIWDVNFRSIS